MNTRALLFGLAGLGVIIGAIVWSTRVQSTEAVTAPSVSRKTAGQAPAVELTPSHELTQPPQSQPPAPVGSAASATKGQAAGTQRQTIDQPPVAPPSVAGPGAHEPAREAPATPEVDPPKLPSLSPIVGGSKAIQSKYTGSTYAERRARADLLQSALDANGDQGGDATDREVYQALKDELIWLRDNMGTPPSEPK